MQVPKNGMIQILGSDGKSTRNIAVDDYLKGKKLKKMFDMIPRILLAYIVQLLVLFFHWVIYFNLEHEL